MIPSKNNVKMPTFAASVLDSVVDFNEDDFGLQDDDEVSRYLKEPILSMDDNEVDALKWWRKNGARFPKLAKIARDFLSVPASTVASEAAFSLSGRVITDYRSSLAPESVSILMRLKSWMDSYATNEWKVPHYNIK